MDDLFSSAVHGRLRAAGWVEIRPGWWRGPDGVELSEAEAVARVNQPAAVVAGAGLFGE